MIGRLVVVTCFLPLLLSAGCTVNQSQRVTGTLINENTGDPVVGESLCLGGMKPDSGSLTSFAFAQETALMATTDDQGRFTFEEVPPATYVLAHGCWKPSELSGGLVGPAPVFGNGDLVILEVEEGQSVKLGTIAAESSNP